MAEFGDGFLEIFGEGGVFVVEDEIDVATSQAELARAGGEFAGGGFLDEVEVGLGDVENDAAQDYVGGEGVLVGVAAEGVGGLAGFVPGLDGLEDADGGGIDVLVDDIRA